ncbi:hypothetical protein NXF25_010343 [Crotalus adamanteus]|uniref:Retrotransposon gag domain-containing protein n=1 Tax=Crotalus adamanteus TaxID=8729 RepID=A0AAW1BJJ5_CROAD
MHLDNRTWVNVITSNLKRNAAGWLVSLHDKGALDMQDLDAFMQALQDSSKDPTAAWHAETCMRTLWQGKWLVAEYIQDFRSLVAHLRDRPECMLFYHFQEGLN